MSNGKKFDGNVTSPCLCLSLRKLLWHFLSLEAKYAPTLGHN